MRAVVPPLLALLVLSVAMPVAAQEVATSPAPSGSSASPATAVDCDRTALTVAYAGIRVGDLVRVGSRRALPGEQPSSDVPPTGRSARVTGLLGVDGRGCALVALGEEETPWRVRDLALIDRPAWPPPVSGGPHDSLGTASLVMAALGGFVTLMGGTVALGNMCGLFDLGYGGGGTGCDARASEGGVWMAGFGGALLLGALILGIACLVRAEPARTTVARDLTTLRF